MEIISNENLENIMGGFNITGAILSALNKSITSILDVGRSLGSALRRISSRNLCPLK